MRLLLVTLVLGLGSSGVVRADAVPDDSRVLRTARVEVQPQADAPILDDVVIVKSRLGEKNLYEVRLPVGRTIRLVEADWECAVYYTERCVDNGGRVRHLPRVRTVRLSVLDVR